MRKPLILAALSMVLTVAIFLGTPRPLFATTCTTNCSVSTLSCTPVSYCTSVPATSLDCDGTVTTCSAADAWCSCQAECFDTCDAICSGSHPTLCGFCMRNCRQTNCGSQTPPPNTTCNL
jgi:hypothetical protein